MSRVDIVFCKECLLVECGFVYILVFGLVLQLCVELCL